MAEQKQLKILIAGAGVAGPALALLLKNVGHKCTIVERASEFRASGQQIDVSGEALKVIKLLGVEEDFKGRSVGDQGMRFVDANDNIVAAFPAGDQAGLVKELEIMRSELVQVFAQKTRGVEYIFGDYVEETRQDAFGVTVRFAKAEEERRFDVVVASDGYRSRTREAAFDASNTKVISLGMYTSFLSLPWRETDQKWSRWYSLSKGRSVVIRPNFSKSTSSAYLGQVTERADELAQGTLEEQKQRVIENFRNAGWETERVLQEIEKTGADFYAQEIGQVKCESLSKGRVVLLGDAGYCPSPLTGQGTTIALIGAYILGGCIVTYPNVEEALAQYEKQVRPFVDKAQSLPPGTPWIVNPQTETGVRVLNTALWVVGLAMKTGIASALGTLGGFLPSFGSKDPILPDYPALGLSGTNK